MAKKKAKAEIKEMKLKMANPRVLRVLIEALSSIYEEVKFHISDSGLFTNVMDPSKICMARIVLEKECFDEFEINEPLDVCVLLNDFNKILKRTDPKDSLELCYKPEQKRLYVKFTKPETKRSRIFTLADMELDIEDVDMNNLLTIQYPTKFSMSPEQLAEILKDAEIYAEHLQFQVNELLTICTSGSIGTYKFECDFDELLEITSEANTTGEYSIDFMKKILKLASITEKLELFQETDHPFKLIFELMEGGKVYYFLAPKVSEEEGEDIDEDDLEMEETESIEEKPEELEENF